MAVNLKVKDLKVRSLDLNFHEVSWKISDTSEDIFDYTFQVLRSESPSGPFDILTQPFEDKYFVIDNVVPVGHRWRTYFYKLKITYKPTGEFIETSAVAKEPEADLIALEIRRHMQLLFREFAGRRTWVLPIRTFGQRCECWSRTLNKKTRSGCVTCFDTGFVRGYLSPIEIWAQFDPSPKTEQNTNVGALQQSNTTARCGSFPPIKPNDLLIEPENRRWRVIQVNQVEQNRARVFQELQLHEIPERDVEFSIPLNMDTALKDLWLSPARNFTNPHNLENFENEEIPGIFSLYSTTYPPIK